MLVFVLLLDSAAGAQTRTQYFRNMVIAPGETVEDAVCVMCSVRVQGRVSSDVVVIWAAADIEANLEGDVVVVGGGVHVAPNVTIQGDIVAFGGPLELGPGARVTGETQVFSNYHFPGQRRVYLRGATFLVMALTLLAGLLALLFPKRRLENIAATLPARPWLSAAIGIALLAVAIAALSFAEDYDWEEIAASLVLLLLTLIILPGSLGIALHLGRRMGITHPVREVMAGAFLAALTMLIPIVGLALCLLFVCLACGITAVSRFAARLKIQIVAL